LIVQTYASYLCSHHLLLSALTHGIFSENMVCFSHQTPDIVRHCTLTPLACLVEMTQRTLLYVKRVQEA